MATQERQLAIRALPVGDLAAALSRGQFTAVEVLAAYRERALEVQKACNAVTYWFEDADAAARHADQHLREHGTPLGPLHGVPFTVKDHIEAKGTPVTLGLQSLRRRVEERRKQGKTTGPKEDAALVAVLKSLGAIPFAKTTMSQMGETWGGGGPAFGDTLNPWDTKRTSGGSSAGEGVLVGAAASAFGIGSDVGGSLRIPSAFCGICTLKPTTGRLDRATLVPGDYSITATAGIMSRKVEDLALIYRWLFSFRLYDKLPLLARIPFNEEDYKCTGQLRVGYFVDEYTQPSPCPSARRAVEEVVEALRQRGHELVQFKPHSEGILTTPELRGADWSFFVSRLPPGKPGAAAQEPEAHGSTKKFLPAWVAEDEPVHPDLAAHAHRHPGIEVKGLDNVRNEGTVGWIRLMARKDELQRRFMKYWREVGLDILICPAWGLPACHVEEVKPLSKIFHTTRVFNFLDMPAGVVPVTQVTQADLNLPYEPSDPDPDVNRAAVKCLEGAEGLPIAVQVVALPFREELALRGMREVQAACPFQGNHLRLDPVPRRSPSMGAPPEPLSTSKL